MSKAALYAGLGQGLMAFGQGAGEAVKTMAIEELRERNLKQHWAREDRIRQEQNAREDRIRTSDIERQDRIRTSDIERQDRIRKEDLDRDSSRYAAEQARLATESAATAEYRREMRELAASRNAEASSQFDVNTIQATLESAEESYQNRVDALRESTLPMGEVESQIRALTIERDKAKLAILDNAPESVLKRSHLIGVRDKLREWDAALKAAPKDDVVETSDEEGGGFWSALGGLLSPKYQKMEYTASGASVPVDELPTRPTNTAQPNYGPYQSPYLKPQR